MVKLTDKNCPPAIFDKMIKLFCTSNTGIVNECRTCLSLDYRAKLFRREPLKLCQNYRTLLVCNIAVINSHTVNMLTDTGYIYRSIAFIIVKFI